LLRYAYERQRELCIGECVPHETCVKNDLQSKLANALFDAFFVKAEDIGDYHVLAKYAEEVGLMTYEEVSLINSFEAFQHFRMWSAQSLLGDVLDFCLAIRYDRACWNIRFFVSGVLGSFRP
jgi:hypothetical protein